MRSRESCPIAAWMSFRRPVFGQFGMILDAVAAALRAEARAAP